jgi:hypothetical protein
MNRKTLIQLSVILICLGVSAFVLYNGFFKNSSPPPITDLSVPSSPNSSQTATSPLADPTNPLPYGDNLAAELKRVLGKNSLQFGVIAYPIINEAEVGVGVTDLVKPLPTP